ncbi:MAG: MBL fold metallo-hydrolase [Deltaproteobacteria bacterium]|nr:MBL fold metallo-hydrolase [Deltaproteobacteria bacterium]
MKIISVPGNGNIYSSNVYLVQGDWKRIEDINTLVDVGNDPAILEQLEKMSTGVGKKKVEQVVLTHSHSDHSALLPMIRERYKPKVFAFSPYLEGVDHVLTHGQRLRMGDRDFEVIHTTGHSEDSISLFNEDEGVLFVGDAQVIVRSSGGEYEEDFVQAMKNICQRNVKKIYFGHGDPICQGVQRLLIDSLHNIRNANRRLKQVMKEAGAY